MKKLFARLNEQDYYLYTIENDYLKFLVSDYGATSISLIEKKTNTDCILGFDKLSDYIKYSDQYQGACIGRNANRIKQGKFTLNNQVYTCPINNGPNSLHGGLVGFNHKTFKVLKHLKDEIQLSYFSKDGEEGFPGNLDFKVTFKLIENSLLFEFEGLCDQDSIFNITNHSYFNLGDKDILNHQLKLFSDHFALVDQDGLTLNETSLVYGSFDFSNFRTIKEAFLDKSDNLIVARGLDHNYLFEDALSSKRATLKYKSLILNVESDLPGLHVYSGNYLTNIHQGICFEAQYYPNGINYQNFKKPIIYQNQIVKHYIKYTLEVKDELSSN